MQTLPISSEPNPTSPFQKSSKIKPIVSSKLSSCPSKNPRLQRKNLLHFPFNQPIPPNFNKKAQSLSSSLSKSKSLLHLLLNDPFAKIIRFQQTCLIFKKLELIKTLKLPLSFWDLNDMKRALKIFARSFQKAHCLTNLDLHFGYNVRLAPILTRKLSSLFRTMQSLKNLSILYPKNNYALGNLILSPLLSGIQKLRSLTHLCIKFYQASIDEDQIQLLYSGLLQCRSLTHLELDFHLCPNLTNEGIRKLLVAGRNLKIASFELRLNVSADPIKEAIFYKDLESIMEFEVQDFSTSNRYSGVSQNSTFKFFYKDSSEPEKLRHFYVRFHQTQDPKQRREYNIQRDLILALPNLQDIKSLNLTCLGYYGNEKLSKNLAARFLQMKSLQELTLEFNYSTVYLPDLSGIFKSLGNLKHIPNLKFLELKFSGFDINASQIKSLFGSCLLKINPLKALELDLGESKISPSIFQSLALLNLCGNLHQLESFRLTLSLTVEKEDHGKLAGLVKGVFSRKQKIELEEFCFALKNLKALKYLDVKFENVHFTSEDQKALSKSLMEMTSLQKIKIESSYDEKLEAKIRGFEDLFIEKAWLTLSVQFHSTKSERIALTPVVFTFEDYGQIPHRLEISFCHYDDAPWHRHYPRFFKDLLEFFKQSSPNFIENNPESHKSLSQILKDSKKTAFLDLTASADKSLDILKAFTQKFSIDDLKFAKYSFTINSR